MCFRGIVGPCFVLALAGAVGACSVASTSGVDSSSSSTSLGGQTSASSSTSRAASTAIASSSATSASSGATATSSASSGTTTPDACDSGDCGNFNEGCVACAIADACKSEFEACTTDPTCSDYGTCIIACSDKDSSCELGCKAQDPTGADEYRTLVECVVCEHCSTACATMVEAACM